MGCCEAEGVAGPFAKEEGALWGSEEVGAHGVDVVGFGGGPDQDAVVGEGVGEEGGEGGARVGSPGSVGAVAVEEGAV